MSLLSTTTSSGGEPVPVEAVLALARHLRAQAAEALARADTLEAAVQETLAMEAAAAGGQVCDHPENCLTNLDTMGQKGQGVWCSKCRRILPADTGR